MSLFQILYWKKTKIDSIVRNIDSTDTLIVLSDSSRNEILLNTEPPFNKKLEKNQIYSPSIFIARSKSSSIQNENA